jgi:UDP-N-acetylmuramate--alanine ligase
VTTYSVHVDADIAAVNIKQQGMHTSFEVIPGAYPPLQVTLNMPGWHNLLNALECRGGDQARC